MCGIAGFNGHFSKAALERMGEKLSHRGPDNCGFFLNENSHIGFAHTRLSIIDLSSAGSQPMHDESGRVTIIFNGEIYNFQELRVNLEKIGCSFRGNSDTEVLLHLYINHGEQMLQMLNGVFAFAIWDSSKNSLFIARDPLGVKPLYYTENSKGVIFASELKALLVNSEVDRAINAYAVMMHLTYLWCPAPHTILTSVKKLLPGYAMWVSDRVIKKMWKYYELPYDQDIVKISSGLAAQMVEEGVKTAVERQMVSDVPVGAFLSGGLDSSAVVAFAKQKNPDQKLHCFTIESEQTFKEGFVDDFPYAKRVAQHLGVELHSVKVNDDVVKHLEQMIYHLDEPLADPAPLNALLIAELAHQYGIKVLLSGAGGDDIFSGYRRHYALYQERYWRWMPKSLRALIASSANNLKVSNSSYRRIRKLFEYADYDIDERMVSYFYWMQPSRGRLLLSEDLRGKVRDLDVATPLLSALENLPPNVLALNRMLFLESKFFLPDHNLNYTDKISMAFGVEVRVPLLDLDLVRIAASLPANYKQHGAEGKWIFKRAMEKYLPHDVIYRPKTGFGAPLRSWLRDDSKLRPLLEDLLSAKSINQRGIFDFFSVCQLLDQDANGDLDATYTIFSMMCIELWCRIFIDDNII